MIFVQILENNETGTIHYNPFDNEKGLHKTESELLQDGILVDSLPPITISENKVAVLKYDGTKLYYEYSDRPLTPEEQTKQEIEALKAQVDALNIALAQVMGV